MLTSSNPLDSNDSIESFSHEHIVITQEPFGSARSSGRLLFDFGLMLSCFDENMNNKNVLDVACGTGWISEWLARLNYSVFSIDLDKGAEQTIKMRKYVDKRVQASQWEFKLGDAHALPFQENNFGHVCCFDSLHHMHDYRVFLSEIHRILVKGGKAIFIEPGAKHSTSTETINFIEQYKKNDPLWIEKDVVLSEIAKLSKEIGFANIRVRPVGAANLIDWSVHEIEAFHSGHKALREAYCNVVVNFIINTRLCFYLEK